MLACSDAVKILGSPGARMTAKVTTTKLSDRTTLMANSFGLKCCENKLRHVNVRLRAECTPPPC